MSCARRSRTCTSASIRPMAACAWPCRWRSATRRFVWPSSASSAGSSASGQGFAGPAPPVRAARWSAARAIISSGGAIRLRVDRARRAGQGRSAEHDDSWTCTCGRGRAREQRERVLQRWYRAQLKALIPPLLEKWQPVLGVQVADWGIKRMKTKWGSCNVECPPHLVQPGAGQETGAVPGVHRRPRAGPSAGAAPQRSIHRADGQVPAAVAVVPG